jgi:hypothetical protein
MWSISGTEIHVTGYMIDISMYETRAQSWLAPKFVNLFLR